MNKEVLERLRQDLTLIGKELKETKTNNETLKEIAINGVASAIGAIMLIEIQEDD